MEAQQIPVEIFCSYAHEDEHWLHKLKAHLSLLKRQGFISLWYDRLLTPGADRAHVIDMHLETASVILLLVSADFFASDYCYGVEMQRALERQRAQEVRVIPILVRPVEWTNAPFAHLQALPTDAQPITTWPDTDTALADITAGLRRVIIEELPFLQASAPRAYLPAIWNVPYPRNPFQPVEKVTFLVSSMRKEEQHFFTGSLRGLGRVGGQRVAIAGTFPTSPLRTVRAPFNAHGSLVSHH